MSSTTSTPFRESAPRVLFEPPVAPRPCPSSAIDRNADSARSWMTTFGISTLIFASVALVLPYRKEGDEFPHLALWIFAGVLLVLTFVAWLRVRFTRWLYSNGVPAVAKITKVTDILVGDRHRYRHFYNTTILFIADGKRIESSWRVATKHEPRVGADLVVFYDPKYPETFVVAPDSEAEEWKVNHPT